MSTVAPLMAHLDHLIGEYITINHEHYQITKYEFVDQEAILTAVSISGSSVVHVTLPRALGSLFTPPRE